MAVAVTIALALLFALLVWMMLTDGAPAFWRAFVLDVQAWQRTFHRELAAAMRAVKESGALAAWSLIAVSFLYGVFHAAGPGHGKFVIATYLAARESRIARGVSLSVAAALAQGVTAIVAVEVVVTLIGQPFRNAQSAASNLEIASYILVGLVGLYLAASASWRLARRLRGTGSAAAGHAGHSHADAGHGHHDVAHLAASDVVRSGRPALKELVAVVASVGIRPCSGGILVLVLAHALSLRLAGMAAVMAMAVGTALTVTVLAVLTVTARKASMKLAAVLPDDRRHVGLFFDTVTLGGGLVIVVLGVSLLDGALAVARHPLL